MKQQRVLKHIPTRNPTRNRNRACAHVCNQQLKSFTAQKPQWQASLTMSTLIRNCVVQAFIALLNNNTSPCVGENRNSAASKPTIKRRANNITAKHYSCILGTIISATNSVDGMELFVLYAGDKITPISQDPLYRCDKFSRSLRHYGRSAIQIGYEKPTFRIRCLCQHVQ